MQFITTILRKHPELAFFFAPVIGICLGAFENWRCPVTIQYQ